MSRQEPLKSARFATKMLPKRVLPICYQTDLGRGLTAGDQPFSIQRLSLGPKPVGIAYAHRQGPGQAI
jgi:hypothetical protein